MPSPHTGDAILEVVTNVLAEWDIIPSKVGNLLPDNGSNIIKAFKNVQATQTHESGESDDEIQLDSANISLNDNYDSEVESNDNLTEETVVQSEVTDFEVQEMEHEVHVITID